jgi:hypothetical protein
MSRFRKKPVVIDAVQYDGTPMGGARVVDWMTHHNDALIQCGLVRNTHLGLQLRTPETREGEWLTADKGDWIIRGVKGEFYPCKPDIFAATYEAVD